MEGLVIQNDQQKKAEDADDLGSCVGAEIDAHKQNAGSEKLCGDKGQKQAGKSSGISPIRKVQIEVFLHMMKHTVGPELATFVTPQHAECASHTAAVNDHGTQHALGKAPGCVCGYQMDQRVAYLFCKKQHEHGADCSQENAAFGGDHIKTVQIRVCAVFCAVAGYQDQVV